ncbi:unnamed protein product [Candidula unifasciata]|uniref:ETS domain-containing protein n=1 Tax=Candidula unifasciata TaxID=100452 RepID=A0A8S3ZAF7_9EUPU|nr:unnamed protein product [Candidula unifasciata]
MALTYDRPVSYQSHMFNPIIEYDHNNINIKMEPHSFDYFAKEPSNVFLQGPSMEDFKIKHKPVLGEPESPQLISWTRTHPQNWQRKEVLDWIYFVVEQEHLDGSKLQGEAYNNFDGKDLCEMDRKQFLQADPYYGSKMYETFRNLVNGVSFLQPKDETDIDCLDTFNTAICTEYTELNRNISRNVVGRSHLSGDGVCDKDRHGSDLMVYHFDNDIKVNLQGLGVYSISPEIEFPFSSNSTYSVLPPKLKDAESFTQPLAPLSPSHLPEFSSLSSAGTQNCQSCYTKPRSLSSFSSSGYTSAPKCSFTVSRKLNSSSCSQTSSSTGGLGRSSLVSSQSRQSLHSSSSSLSPCRMDKIDHGYLSEDSGSTSIPPYHHSSLNTLTFTDDIHMEMGHQRGYVSVPYHEEIHITKKKDKKNRNNATKNGNHLWEFVRDLLRDPKTNPKLLKWEDKENGVFRFVQSEKVAQLWGEKKNNPLMTYEKLSRAMSATGFWDSFKMCPEFGGKF